jgi:AraC family transcriptional regulator
MKISQELTIKKRAWPLTSLDPSSNASSSLRPRRKPRAEFLYKETSLRDIDSKELIKGSEGLGWSNMIATHTRRSPLEFMVPPESSLFFGIPMQNLKLSVQKEGREFHGEILANRPGIIAPGIKYRLHLPQPSELLYIYIKNEVMVEVADEIFGKRLGDIDIYSPLEENDTTLQHLLQTCMHMLSETHDSSFRSDYIARAIVAQVYSRHTHLRDTPRTYDSNAPLSQAQIRRISDYMQTHISGDFQVAELAASIGLSRTIFFERFLHTTKHTPNQYLQIMRINKAKQLLREKKLSLADIAFACGYADQSHFARFFKRFVGASPGKYRVDIS